MADPKLITQKAVGLGRLGPATIGGSAPTNVSLGPLSVAVPVEVATSDPQADGPQPVLIIGEGATVDVLEKLFTESSQYMLWREPRTWKAISHMPDELYASTVRALLDCQLSAQQLLVLHSEAPDYDPQGDSKGSGLLSGAPAVTAAEKEHIDWLTTLYSERRQWRPGDKRFCAPGIATAAIVSRFTNGVPTSLAELPIKVIAMVRHPSDVVIERLQAKPVKGMVPYPECMITTIGTCADTL